MKLIAYSFLLHFLFNISAIFAEEGITTKSYLSAYGDSLIEGRTYEVILSSGMELEGTLTGEDSISITLKSGGDLYRLPRNEIESIHDTEFEYAEIKTEKSESPLHLKNVTTGECEIYLKNRTLYKNVVIKGFVDSVLKIEKEGVKRKINVFEINKIKFKSSWDFWDGALIGAAIPLAFTIFYAAFAEKDEAKPWVFIFGLGAIIPSGVIGGVIGLIATKDDLYDLSTTNQKAKIKRLNYIIEKHRKRKIQQ